MKLKDGMYAWNPDTAEIKVGPWPDLEGWSDRFQYNCDFYWKIMGDLNADSARDRLLFQARYLVSHHGLNPQAVHQEFLAFDEYRDGLEDDNIPAAMLKAWNDINTIKDELRRLFPRA